MADMKLATFISSDAELDDRIEELVGKQVRGELSPEDLVLLTRLVARRARLMRPGRKSGRWSVAVGI
jgi:hypothetical protein